MTIHQKAEAVMRKMDRRTRREIAAIKVGTVIVCKVNHHISNNDVMGSAQIVHEGGEYTVRRVLDKNGRVEVMGDKNGSYTGRLAGKSTCTPVVLRWGEYSKKAPLKSCKALMNEMEEAFQDCQILMRSVSQSLHS